MKFGFRVRRIAIVVVTIGLLFGAGDGLAQTNSSGGTLRGTVTDPSGGAIAGATITVTPTSGQPRTATTDAQGAYEMRGLSAGPYDLKASAPGFEGFEKADVAVRAGEAQTLDLPLAIQVQKQEVQVAGQTQSLDVSPENNAGAVVLKGADLDALSDDPDELQADLQALAGPSIGPNGGQMYIDGFTGGALPPKSSIREIRINSNPFSAEYDRLGFGRIEILTKPGTDSTHGSFFIMGNSNGLNTSNRFVQLPAGTTLPGYYTLQYNGNIGGALGKKASYFFTVQRRNINEVELGAALDPVTFVATPNGIAVANPRTRTEISPRLDYQLTKNNTLTARYQYELNNEQSNGIGQFSVGTQGYNNVGYESNLQISDSQIISNRLVYETRFSMDRSHSDVTPLSTAVSVQVPSYVSTGGTSQGFTANTTVNYELQNYFTLVSGKHALKFGARWRDTNQSNTQVSNANGTFSFQGITGPARFQAAMLAIANGQVVPVADYPDQFTISTGIPLTTANMFDAGLYVQDDYRWRPNVTLSAGARFETQTGISDFKDIAPRVAVAWGVGKTRTGAPKYVLRGGWGIFYDRFSESNILALNRNNGVHQVAYLVQNPNFFPNIPAISSLTATTGTVSSGSQLDPNFRAPYTMETAATLEHAWTSTVTMTVNYVNARGVRQLVTDNINAPNPLLGGARPDPAAGNINQYESHGIFRQNQLSTSFVIRANRRLTLNASYTLNYASGTPGTPSNPYNLGADYGRTMFDVRHRVLLVGNISAKWGISLSPFITVSSGAPFNITAGQDLNLDGINNDRPTFGTAADLAGCSPTVQCAVATPYGILNPNAPLGEQVIPINFGIAPVQFSTNLRISKSFSFGRPREAASNAGGPGGDGGPGRGPGGGFGGGIGRGPGGGGGEGGGRGPGGGGFGGGGFGGGRGGGGGGRGGTAGGRRYNLTFSANARNLLNVAVAGTPVGSMSAGSNFLKPTSLSGGGFGGGGAAYNRQVSLQATFSF